MLHFQAPGPGPRMDLDPGRLVIADLRSLGARESLEQKGSARHGA